MSIIRQPDFKVPLQRAVQGMVLSRNLEHNGQTLVRHGTELTAERLERLNEIGVMHIYVHFEDDDVKLYKELLSGQDSEPDYCMMRSVVQEILDEAIPPFARPQHAARSHQLSRTVSEVIDHTMDVVLGSRRCFELLRATRFMRLEPLRHCPAAWVYAICTGAGLGYSMPALLDLSIAALFYDVGMLRVPSRILAKPGPLTELEFAEIKKHVYFGRRMLGSVTDFSSTAALVAFQHHEQYHGGGYPRGLRGDSIHEFSQIVALTDKFAALVSERAHRQRFQPWQAHEMLLAQTKSVVSPRIFIAFLKSVLIYPRGSTLRLSTGEIAEPQDFPLHMPARPRVRITHGRHGEELASPRMLDLAEHPEIAIESFAILEDYAPLLAELEHSAEVDELVPAGY